MAKNCINPQCEKEIPSNATFCSFCGTQQGEHKNLSQEEKLRKEIVEMQDTIQLLKKALTDAQQNNDSSVEKQQVIESLQKQLDKVQATEQSKQIIQAEVITNRIESKRSYGLELEETDTRMFRRPFSFKGRIRRTEFCISYLIYLVYYLPMSLMEESDINEGFAVIWLLLLIPMIWFLLAQGTKRCHDRNNSGWYQIIPFYGFWMLFAEGDSDENDYGKSPK